MMYPESIQCNYLLKYKPGALPGKYSLRSFSGFFFFKDYSSTMDKKLKRLLLVLKMEIALFFAIPGVSGMLYFLHVWRKEKKRF